MTIRFLKHIIYVSIWHGVSTMQGFWVRSLRTHLELSQKELAKLAKVSTKAVDLLEKGQALPLEEKRKILAQLYAEKARKMSCH